MGAKLRSHGSEVGGAQEGAVYERVEGTIGIGCLGKEDGSVLCDKHQECGHEEVLRGAEGQVREGES